MKTLLMTFGMITLAEMGDKTQLMALAFATQFSAMVTAVGFTVGILGTNLLAAGLGVVLGIALPILPLKICAALVFVGFALWTVLAKGGDEDAKAGKLRNPIITVALATFLAEMGDKTQLAALTIAAQTKQFFPVWIGSTLGMAVAVTLAIIVGKLAKRGLPERLVKYASAAVFAVFGIMTGYEVLHQVVVHSAKLF